MKKFIAYVEDDIDDKEIFIELFKEVSVLPVKHFENGIDLLSYLKENTEDEPCFFLIDMYNPATQVFYLAK